MSSNSNTLLGLPREIRDQIFSYFLISPTGMITYGVDRIAKDDNTYAFSREMIPINLSSEILRPEFRITMPGGARIKEKDNLQHLPLLLTCRKFGQECREMLCEKNAFFGWPSLSCMRNSEISVLRDIRHIIFECKIDCNKYDAEFKLHQPNSLKAALSICEAWSSIETLQRITLFFPFFYHSESKSYKQYIMEKEADLKLPHRSTEYRLKNADIDYCKSVLQQMESLKDVLSSSHVKLDIRMIYNYGEYPGREPKAVFHETGLMRELHEGIGADLWANGRLCYKDGFEIGPPFKIEI
ncbi:hypothetical protein OCU04_003830 [Sclerotinia nivalis]|uniref:Uncharacterized protein n=1 Tax=Sclerotinia nivalis TaxID=352851 RepID=A0A9X0AW74_9HELO|nr:hypothetical protein OCU04_003830 [Sclerotinia nivalis]